MLAKDGDGTADFENGNKDGWPASTRVWGGGSSKANERKTVNKKTHHAMGKVTNNEINCMKLKPIDFAPSDSSK